jgi:hypothetical protein
MGGAPATGTFCILAVFTGTLVPVPEIPDIVCVKRGLNPQSKQCFMLLAIPFSER